jgi:hypothetical protein
MQMANRTSTQGRFAAGSPSTALRATVIHLTPMLFAAVLVGCTTKAQTRGASQATAPAQAVQPSAAPAAAESGYAPPPYEEPSVSSPLAEEQSATPPVFKDEGSEQAQEESVAQPEVFELELKESMLYY